MINIPCQNKIEKEGISLYGMPTILIVDDATFQLDLMVDLLGSKYDVIATKNGHEVMNIVKTENPDLILLDIVMPELSGFEIAGLLKKNKYETPIMFISSLSDQDTKVKAFNLGCVDYLTKPIIENELLVRIRNHLDLRFANQRIHHYNTILEMEVRKRTEELIAVRSMTIVNMCTLAEARDEETGKHIIRTQEYVRAIARNLQRNGRFLDELTDKYILTLVESAPLHDIGKVAIPDHILLKPSKLTPEEFEIMKTHTTIGNNTLLKNIEDLQDNRYFLEMAAEIAYCHHERWNGTGYPRGLQGEKIPLSARIMTLADIYDALTSKRCYKEAFTHEAAKEVLLSEIGKAFDSRIVEAFIEVEDLFLSIKTQHEDE